MSTSNHIIERIVFDIDYNNQGKVNDLQNRVSRLFNNQVSDDIAPLFDKIFPKEVQVTFDTVEVVLPPIAIEYIERDLGDAVLNGIKEALGERLDKLFGSERDLSRVHNFTSTEGDVSIISVHGLNLKLLEEYLLLGVLPWNATKSISGPDDLFLSLHEANRNNLRDLISGLGPNLTVRKRLAYQLGEETIHKVIELVEPTNANFIINYHSEVVRVQEEKRDIPTGLSDFRKAVWLFIFTYLFVDRGSYYNQKDFIKSTLTQLANQYNLSYGELIGFFSDALSFNKWKALNTTELVFIINELGKEEERSVVMTRSAANRERNVDDITDTLDLSLSVLERFNAVRYFLSFGSLPQSMADISKADIDSMLIYLLDTSPALTRDILTTEGKTEAVRYRLANAFNDAITKRVLLLLETAHNETVAAYADKIKQAIKRSPLMGAEDSRLEKTIRKYILDYLLTERGNTFEDKSFLKYSLAGIARHYNIAYSAMLNEFTDSLKETNVLGEKDLYLFSLLHEIGKENVADSAAEHDYVLASAEDAKEQATFEEDTLKQWLSSGTIAWWHEEMEPGSMTMMKKAGEDLYAVPYMPPLQKLKYWVSKGIFFVVRPEEKRFSPEDMLTSLVAAAPDSALNLLKFAGTREYSRKRFTTQISADLKLDIISLLPFGRDLRELYSGAINAIEARFQLTATDRALLSNEAFNLLWVEMINGGYKDFNEARYVSALSREIPRLLRVSSSALIKKFIDDGIIRKPALLPKEIKKQHANNANSPKEENEEALTLAFDAVNEYIGRSAANEPDKRFSEERLDEYKQNTGLTLTPNAWVFFSRIINHFIADGSPRPAKVFAGAADIFSYYLDNNKLPGDLATLSSSEQALFLKQLVFLIYKENRLRFLLQFGKDGRVPEARIRLRDIFHVPGNAIEADIRNSLDGNTRQDVASYIDGIVTATQGKATNMSLPVSENTAIVNDEEQPQATSPGDILKHGDATLIKEALTRVATSETVMTHISEGADTMNIYNVLKRSGELWSDNAMAFMKQTELMLISSLSDLFIIKTIKALFREFNLRYLAGRYSINSASSYILSLFGFLSERRDAIGATTFTFLVTNSFRYLEEYPVFTASLLSKIDSASPATDKATNNAAKTDTFIQTVSDEQKRQEEALSRFHEELIRVTDSITEQQDNDMAKASTKPGELTSPETPVADTPAPSSPTVSDIDTNIENIQGKIYVDNAGLTMLHPFLATYFDRLGMLKSGDFKDQDTRVRAAYLLQYLVFGATDFPEHAMVLNKILVELPIATPLPGGIEVTEQEKNVSAQLINAVIQNWDKLKNTAPESFRASFLQRAGILTFMDNDWTLKVEQRGYDIILQTLPWGLSMIKCPWMSKFLYIQWI